MKQKMLIPKSSVVVNVTTVSIAVIFPLHAFLREILMNPFFSSGKACQVSDWKVHKTKCVKHENWFDKHRKCRDGTVHEGKLELITWSGEREGYTLGWGASFEEESEDLRNMFEEKFRGDMQRFYGYRPQALRWMCCGTSAGMDYGCEDVIIMGRDRSLARVISAGMLIRISQFVSSFL